MNFLSGLLVSGLLVMLTVTSTLADQIQLSNGDRISGRILDMAEGKLRLETDYAGILTLPWDKVANVVADQSLKVVLRESTTLSGQPQAEVDGRMRLAVPQVQSAVSFDLDQVVAINPPTKPAVALSGRINAGLSKSDGNTDEESAHLDAELVARTASNRYTVGLEYNREENEDDLTEKNYLGYAKYDHFLTEKWYFYANTLFEKDEFKDLNLRSTLGAGIGYQFFETKALNLSVEAGLGYVNEDFIEGDDSDAVSARWAVNFDRLIYKELIRFFHFHEGYLSLEDTADLFIRSRTGFRIPLSAGLQTTLQYNYDWDNSPSPGEERSDTMYLLTLGYEFD